jgi:hypothetical protein
MRTGGCFLQGDAGTKVKTPDAGKNESRRDFKLHYFPVQGSCLVPNIHYLFICHFMSL